MTELLWLNGRFLDVSRAGVSPFDRGFLYGDGCFETMRAEHGVPLFVTDHLERLEAALAGLRIPIDRSIDWERLIRELLGANGLLEKTATVKIIATRGGTPGLGLPAPVNPTLCVTAREYSAPPPHLYHEGWRLHIFTDGFAPPLAEKKTLNYLYYLTARQAALDSGCHEAVILDAQGRVTETSAGSLLIRTAGRWWTPESPWQLPGTTIRQAAQILLSRGETVERRPSTVQGLLSADTVWVLNSMVLVMPVREAAGRPFPDPAPREAAELREELISRGTIRRREPPHCRT